MVLKRPLCLLCVCYITGIVLSSFFPVFIFIFASIILIATGLVIISKYKIKPGFIIMALIIFIFGWIITQSFEHSYSTRFADFYSNIVEAEGYIDSEITQSDQNSRFVYKINSLVYMNKRYDIKGKILVYLPPEQAGRLEYRSSLLLTGKLTEPKPMTNPGGFNYKRYLQTSGILGLMYINNPGDINLIGINKGGWLKGLGLKIRFKVVEIVNKCLGKNQAGLLNGMLIGYKDGLDDNAYQAFSKAGLTHIMVASGMNVAFIILPLIFAFKKLHIKNTISSILIIAVLIIFVFAAGFSASVVRAVIMGTIILVSKIIYRDPDIYTSIAVSAFILLIINPLYLFDIGFQLSFSATLSIVLFYSKVKKLLDFKYIPEIAKDTLAATISAQLGVIPVTLYYFNNLSIISLLSNLLVVPLVQIITIAGFIMVFIGLLSTGLAQLCGYVNNAFLSFVLFITETSANLPFASVKLPTPSLLGVFIYYFIVLYCFQLRFLNICFKKACRYIIILLLTAFIIKSMIPKPFEITFLDVKQGDCAFIRTDNNKKILIDGGGKDPKLNSGTDIGESTVVPLILDKGTKHIDIVVATHGHDDHTQGLDAVIDNIDVGMVIIPNTNGKGFERLLAGCRRKNIKVVRCGTGDNISIDRNTVLNIISPGKKDALLLDEQAINDSSLVIKLIYKKVKVLFTGDSGVEVEKGMIEKGVDLKADILKVAHHGSPTSTSQEFINSVKPRYSIISVGPNNFGHPSQFIIDRLEERGVKLYRTDISGAVTVTSNGNTFKVTPTIK